MDSSRRKILQKTALFIVPSIMTFNLKDIQASVSGESTDRIFEKTKRPKWPKDVHGKRGR
jgi:hypothetical protein